MVGALGLYADEACLLLCVVNPRKLSTATNARLCCVTLFVFVQVRYILQSGEVVALKKVALKKLEDGIPNTALR